MDSVTMRVTDSLNPKKNIKLMFTDAEMLFDRPVADLREAARSFTAAERDELSELERFAVTFKKQRIKYGFTQGDVGQALGRRYGSDFSQTTISRFEAGNLSYKNMCKLRPLLDEWLNDAENAIAGGVALSDIIDHGIPYSSQSMQNLSIGRPSSVPSAIPIKKRRKRTSLDLHQQNVLEIVFKMNQRPNNDHMAELADQLKLDRDVVRVWFCNRRQKMRRVGECDNHGAPTFSGQQSDDKNVTAICSDVKNLATNNTDVSNVF